MFEGVTLLGALSCVLVLQQMRQLLENIPDPQAFSVTLGKLVSKYAEHAAILKDIVQAGCVLTGVGCLSASYLAFTIHDSGI